MTTHTTTETITDEQIRALRTESAEAGDMEQIVICDIALGYSWTDITAEEYTADGTVAELRNVATKLASSTLPMRDAARAECARVIADAQSCAP